MLGIGLIEVEFLAQRPNIAQELETLQRRLLLGDSNSAVSSFVEHFDQLQAPDNRLVRVVGDVLENFLLGLVQPRGLDHSLLGQLFYFLLATAKGISLPNHHQACERKAPKEHHEEPEDILFGCSAKTDIVNDTLRDDPSIAREHIN